MSEEGKLSWLLALEDRVSAPAGNAAKKLHELEQRMDRLRKAEQQTSDPALQKRLAAKLAGLGVEKVEALGMAQAEKHAHGWVSTLDHGLGIAEKVGESFLKIGELAVSAGEKIADWTKDAINLAGGKEREFISFKAMLHDGAAAKELMEKLERVSSQATFSDDDALGMGRRLLAGGFKADEIPTIIKALGDAAGATGAGIEKVQDAVGALRRINSDGALTAKTMRALSAAGVPASGVYKVLASDLHVTAEKARELVKAGKVDANEGLWAVVKATRDVRAGGVLGSAGATAVSESSDMLMGKIKQKWEDNFSSLWDSKGFEKWKGFLRNLNNSLDTTSESGKRLNESITGAFDHLLSGVFGDLAGPNGLKGTTDLVTTLSYTIDRVGVAVGGLARGLLGSLDPALGKLGLLGEGPLDPEKAKRLSDEFAKLGERIGHAVERATELLGTLDELLGTGGKKVPGIRPVEDGMVEMTTGHPGKGVPLDKSQQFQEPSFWRWVTGQSTAADWGEPEPEAVAKPSTTLAASGSRTSTTTGVVHQTNHFHGSTVDPKAIGEATRAGQRTALEEDEDRGGDHGSYEE